jgi:hypothetical protein
MKHEKQLLGALLLSAALSQSASALPVLTNGDFESGFIGWSRADQLASDGTFFQQSGTNSPVNGDAVPAPPGGNLAAMTDAGAGGSHLLYQDFLIGPPITSATLKFDLYIGNRAGLFAAPATLDWAINAFNQQFRVDILTGSADPFSILAGDILASIYQTQDTDPMESGYDSLSFDITSVVNAHLGQSLRLRFAEVDNIGPLQVGVDNVSIDTSTTSVPEPTSLALVLGGILLGSRRARRHT